MKHALFTRIAAVRDQLAASDGVVLGVFVVLVVCLVQAIRGRLWAAVALVPLAGLWALVDQRLHGSTLVALSYHHGISTADLPAVVALLVAAWRLLAAGAQFARRAVDAR